MGLRRLNATSGTALAWAIFLGFSALIYVQALGGGFFFDDLTYIVNSPLIHAPHALAKIWFSREPQDYWPLSYSLFRFEWLAFGAEPLGYHLVNLALHAACCALLWRVLLRLRFPYPFFAALLFCAHPLNVESVAWIFQTKTTLSSALVLLSTLLYLRAETADSRKNYLAALGCFAAANLAKISVVTWPAVLLGYEWYRAGFRLPGSALKRVAPFFALSLAFGALNLFWYSSVTMPETMAGLSPLARLAGMGQTAGFYLYKSILPFGLALIYPRWNIDSTRVLTWVPLAILLGGLTFLAFRARKSELARGGLLTALFFLATLFPALGLLRFHYQSFSWVADHYAYLSLAGLIAAGVAGGAALLRGSEAKIPLAGALAILLVSACVWRAADYAEPEALWRDTLAKNPDAWVAHHDLGVILLAKGKVDEASSHYAEAVRLKPDHADSHYGLGVTLYSEGKLPEAIAQYRETLRLDPDYLKAHQNLGAILANRGEIQEALEHFSAAVRIAPEDAEAHNNLGVILAALKQPRAAADEFVLAVRLNPAYKEARANLTAINPALAQSLTSN